MKLEAVEIDSEMSEVATNWFGFQHNDNVTVHIADGLDFILQLEQKGLILHTHVMFVDILLAVRSWSLLVILVSYIVPYV